MKPANFPPRTLLWDRGSVWDPIVRVLAENGICEVVLRFAFDQEGTHHPHPFYSGHFINPEYQGGGQEIYAKVCGAFPIFMDMNCRNSGYDTTDYYNEKTFHDHLNVFNGLFDYFHSLLRTNQVDLVLYSRPPHLGADYLLYVIAHHMGIRCVFLYQSLFPRKYFFGHQLEDFGDFDNVPQLHEPRDFSIERGHKNEWFYMRNVGMSFLVEYIKRTARRLSDTDTRMETLRNLLAPHKYCWFVGAAMERRPGTRFFKDLCDIDMRGQALFRYQNERRYRRNLRRAIVRDVRLGVDYVYFPLHLQPEATTSALGGIYCDQALAIERLSKFIPKNWVIYIKENPKQNSTMRGPWFFARLKAIKNAVFVPTETSSFELTEHCRFVATITGTAGWEAISGGKNTLVFGRAWFKNLPGVFSFDEHSTLRELIEYKINHTELEASVSRLQARMGDGVIDSGFLEVTPDFDEEVNATVVAASLQKFLSLSPT